MRKRRVALIAGIVGVLAVVVGAALWKPVMIRYHYGAMARAGAEAHRVGWQSNDQGRYIKAFEAHRDALVRLDYWERKAIQLQNLVETDRRTKTLWRELCTHSKDPWHVEMGGEGYGYGNPVRPVVTIYDTHANMAGWEQLIRESDVPDSASSQPLAQTGATPASDVHVDELDPKQILAKVVEQYKAMQSYQAEGTVIEDLEIDGREMHTTASFSMKLKKPNLYLIAWTRKDTPMPGMEQSGAVWNAGAQPYLYMGIGATKTCSKMTSDEMAIAGATGISDGVAHTIPSLFFPQLQPGFAARMQLTNPRIEKIETLDGEDCYVISGSSFVSKEETLWISTKRFLIVQWSRSHERPEGQPRITEPEMTDQQLDETLKMAGQKPTAESRAKMRGMMNRAREATKNMTIKGISCERHGQITTPELRAAEFEFKVPEGTAFNDSLFEVFEAVPDDEN